MVFRYALLFMLPVLLAVLLEYLTLPMQEHVRAQASDWINRAASPNPDVAATARAELPGHDMLGAISRLDWLFLGSVFSGVIAVSFLIPTRLIASKGINLLTAIILGFAAARFFFGFYRLASRQGSRHRPTKPTWPDMWENMSGRGMSSRTPTGPRRNSSQIALPPVNDLLVPIIVAPSL